MGKKPVVAGLGREGATNVRGGRVQIGKGRRLGAAGVGGCKRGPRSAPPVVISWGEGEKKRGLGATRVVLCFIR